MWARLVVPAGCKASSGVAASCTCPHHLTLQTLRLQQRARIPQERQLQAPVKRSIGSPPAPAKPPPPANTPAMGAAVAVVAGAVAILLAAPLLNAEPCLALQFHEEPANALSLPTWAVHTSTIFEWIAAMGLVWQLGEVSSVPQWKGLAWAMFPNFLSGTCAFTWHLFYNSPALESLRGLQALLTFIGNCALWWAAYRIYRAMKQREV